MTAAVILAGGLARRMGGGDKSLRLLNGRPILDHVIARLRPQVDQIVLNVNGDPSRFCHYGLPTVSDSVEGYAGPLAGILAGLDWAADQGHSSIVSVAADTPFFPPDLVARLDECQAQSGLCLAATKSGDHVYRQPTFGLWSVALRDDLRAALGEGVHKVVKWTDRHGAGTAEWSDGPFDPFFNINTPDDLRVAQELSV